MDVINKLSHSDIKVAAIFIGIAFVAMTVLSIWFDYLLGNELQLSINNELESLSTQQQIIIQNQNFTNINSLSIMATAISEGHVKVDDIEDYLKSQKSILGFNEVYYVNLDGEGVSCEGKRVNFSDNEAYINAIESGEHYSSITGDATTNNGIMDIAYPINVNGKVQGVLLGKNDIKGVIDQLITVVGENGYIVITNSEGKDLVTSDDDYVPFSYLSESNVVLGEGESITKVQQDLAEGVGGKLTFTILGVTRIAQYTPLGFGGLNVVIVLDETSFESGIKEITSIVDVISFWIMFVFVGFILHTWNVQRRSIKKIEEAAYIDKLTNLPNLAKLKKDLSYILNENKDKQYTIIKVDVKNFKSINEIYGFDIGNKFLQVFKSISETAPEKSLIVARIGIDEFIFFSGNGFLDTLEESTAHYESFFKMIIPELKDHHLAFSYGRYKITLGETDIDEIINKVSLAHTMSKEKKNSAIYDYDDDYKQKVLVQTTIINKMKKALQNNEFVAFLQPKVNLNTYKLVGAEALVRWIESDGKIIFPNEFIPVFESNGFIVELDKFILECVCKSLSKWRTEGKACYPISVNFSRLHLEKFNFIEDIKQIVDKYEVPHELIEIEITETTVLQNEAVLGKFIDDLHNEKFTISIDDFGAGYSSLGLLKDFKFNTLKLDRSFLSNTKDNKRGEIVIEGIVNLAHSLNLDLIAEGIEDEPQIEFLRSINCQAAQGYYFAKPMPIIDFEKQYI